MSFTNSQLAQKISNLIEYWSGFASEYATWLAGTVNGGPSSDGRYPLTDWHGIESLVKAPAQLEEDVDGLVSSASASATAADGSATVAEGSASTATTQAGLADDARILAQTARTNAETAESSAVDAKVTAIAQAAAASASATSASDSASAAAISEANASDSEDAAAASAAAAATFDPDNFYLRTALDGGQLDNRYYTEGEVDSLLGGKSATSHNHDAAYAALSHSHGDLYYTEGELDSLLSGKSATSHNHDAAYAALSHTHSYLPLSGGVLNGHLTVVAQSQSQWPFRISHGASGHSGFWYTSNQMVLFLRDDAGNLNTQIYGNGSAILTGTASIQGETFGSGTHSQVGHSHSTANITSGTFADARIAQSNVTQHEGALGSTTGTVEGIARRDGSGDLHVRLIRSEYDTTNSDIGFIMTQVDTASNNYLRPSTPEQLADTLQTAGMFHHSTSGYNSGKVSVQSSAPSSPAQGDIWFDIS